jgi:hypothetical protein
MTRPQVEILYLEGCPNHDRARGLVEQIAAELRLEPKVNLVKVRDAEAAVEHNFLGSPTIRVDGRDVEPAADDRTDVAFSCRVYRTDNGFSGQPTEAWIREALEEAVGKA